MLAVVGITWAWTVGLILLDALGVDVKRHHYESAGVAFGAALLWFHATRARLQGVGMQPPRVHSALHVAIPAAVACAAFLWSVNLGPLSDDYVLRRWAMAGNWVPPEWSFVRPLPLGVWWGILSVGGDWGALHLLNVLLHASNAALVASIAGSLVNRGCGLVAGLVFGIFPASLEAVAWTAGVFDLFATLFVLLAARTWLAGEPTFARTGPLTALLTAGVLSKESAFVLPGLLILLEITVTRPPLQRRQAIGALAALSAAAIVLLLARTFVSSALVEHLDSLPADRRQLKDLIVRPFAALAVPLRTEAGVGVDTLVCATLVLLLIGLLVLRVARSRSSPVRIDLDAPRSVAVLVGCGWIMASALPLLTQFHVSPTLDGSRLLYLPSAGFALVVAAATPTDRQDWMWKVAAAALTGLLCLYVFRLSEERALWNAAAVERDALLAQAAHLAHTQSCRTLTVVDAPDNIRGVYLFRNGIDDAIALIPTDPAGSACTFRWAGALGAEGAAPQ